MNILIVGEFSGFAKHLKAGFMSLGHNAIVVMDGDGFKKIPSSEGDIVYDTSRDLKFLGYHIPLSNRLWFKEENARIINRLKSLRAPFDLIVVICDVFVSIDNTSVGVPLSYIVQQVHLGAKVIFASCGGDPAYQIFKKELWYYNVAFPRNIRNYIEEFKAKRSKEKFCEILNISNCVVTTASDYYYTISRFKDTYYKNKLRIVYSPLPISEMPEMINPCSNRKILIFHGVIRARRKGTPFILEALDRIEKEYKDKVDIVVKGNIPYKEYVAIFEKIDILIDQTNGNGVGMNTNLGLMCGKVVLSNNELDEEKIRGYKSPVINIRPDSNQIYEELKKLIESPDKIDKIKKDSRIYAMTYLKSDIIAKSYLDFVGL